MSHVVLAGGVGAARYLTGAIEAFDPATVTGVVNVADDVVLHGLHVSPDLDTCTYTLAGAIDPERGWGLVDESWQAMAELGRYGGANWFSLGDRDLGTHLYRTARLHDGATLTEITAEITAAWGLTCRLLPVTDDRIETRVTLIDDREVGFQEYFVGMQHSVDVGGVRFDGADHALLSPPAAEAIISADALVIARRIRSSRSGRSSPCRGSRSLSRPAVTAMLPSHRSSAAPHSRDLRTACCESWARKAPSSGWPAAIAILPPRS